MRAPVFAFVGLACCIVGACSSHSALQASKRDDGGAAGSGPAGTIGSTAGMGGAPVQPDDGGASPAAEGPGGDAGAQVATDAAAADANRPWVKTVASMGCSVGTIAPTDTAVTAALRIQCEGFAYAQGLSIVANGIDGASVTADISEGADTSSHLFTLAPHGTSRVEIFPGVDMSQVAVDQAGQRSVFSWGTADDAVVRRFRELDGGWVREDVPTASQFGGEPGGVRVIDDNHAAIVNDIGGDIELGVRDASGWHYSQALGLIGTEFGTGMDMDSAGRPWACMFARHNPDNNVFFVDVVSPDGHADTIATAYGDATPPSILASGLTGADSRPAVAFWTYGGASVATVVAGNWYQRLAPGPPPRAIVSSDCPAPLEVLSPCNKVSCTEHTMGAGPGLALARTSSGKAFLAWIEIDSTTVRALVGPPPCSPALHDCQTCGSGGDVIQRSGSATLAVARVPSDASMPLEAAHRIRFDNVPEALAGLAVSTRGETLLIVTSLGADIPGGADLRYVELDTTKL